MQLLNQAEIGFVGMYEVLMASKGDRGWGGSSAKCLSPIDTFICDRERVASVERKKGVEFSTRVGKQNKARPKRKKKNNKAI